MKSGQNLHVALTALEEMASQFSLQLFSMAPNQSLIQFISILPESEYEVEKRLFCNGLQPDGEQVLMAIRSRFKNLQRQHKKGGERKDAGHDFVADTGGGMSGRIISRPAAEVGERGERVVVEEAVGNPMMMERMISKRWPVAGLVGVRLKGEKGATRSVSVAARRDISPSAALIRSAACVVVKAIRLRSAPTLLLFYRARTPRAQTTKTTWPSAARKRRPSYATCQASITMSRLTMGVVVRSLGIWGISR